MFADYTAVIISIRQHLNWHVSELLIVYVENKLSCVTFVFVC